MFLAKLKNKIAAQHQGTDATATSDSATPGVTDGISFGKTEDHMLCQKAICSPERDIIKDALTIWYTADTVARSAKDHNVVPPLRLVRRRHFEKVEHKVKFSRVLKPVTHVTWGTARKRSPWLGSASAMEQAAKPFTH